MILPGLVDQLGGFPDWGGQSGGQPDTGRARCRARPVRHFGGTSSPPLSLRCDVARSHHQHRDARFSHHLVGHTAENQPAET